MQMSLGGVTSGSGEAFATKANVDKIFCMTPSGSADPVIKDKQYSFRLCFGDPDQGALAAEEIKAANYTNVGAIYDESDSYSSGIYEAFKAKMAELNISYTEMKFDKENNKDFSTQANALKDCDVVFMPFYYTEASLFIKAAVEKQCNAVFFGCDGFDGISPLVEGVTNKIMYITPFDAASEDANVKAFVEAYKAEYGTTPDQFAADAYDVVMVLAAALEKAGITDYELSAAELGDILYNTVTAADFSYDGLTGDDMTWSKDGKCTKAPKIVVLN
jgi:branched-chain amino acid transport system substrate-binding protein